LKSDYQGYYFCSIAEKVDVVTNRRDLPATTNLRSMNEGRNHEMFMTGLNLSRLGLSPNEIEAELNAVVGTEPHMKKKVPGVIKSLGRYGRR
jgi:hypothetical protein